MFPAAFEYRSALSLEDAISALSADEDAKVIAGGHSLVPLMKLRLATPSLVVDIGRLRDLSYIRVDGDEIAIGALSRHRDLEISEVLAAEAPALCAVAHQVGDPSVRHRGTIGGSVAHGDGASDLPAALLAMDATFVVTGPSGERTIPASAFFKGFLETALTQGEVLREIRVPRGYRSYAYQKFNRRAQDWAIVGVVVVRNGVTKIGYVNMAATPVRALAVEERLGAGEGIAEAAAHAADGLSPPADLNASPSYRAHLASVLVRRALTELR
ncbi:MAG: FAD binding domain-containing protein [Ferrimicrobium sp.]